jgi:hypothetical protein
LGVTGFQDHHFPVYKRFAYKFSHSQPTSPGPVLPAFLYSNIFPLEVDGDPRFGDKLTHLCPDPLDQEEPWKERLMIDNASSYKTQNLYPSCSFLVCEPQQLDPAQQRSALSSVPTHTVEAVFFSVARASLPGQHFQPPRPTFPAQCSLPFIPSRTHQDTPGR